jgi:succinoglycan biosynthesis transport protein ExoP
MEEEIDLRAYIEVLLRYWYWIVGLAVVAAVAAFVFISLQPEEYEASSVVIVTEPRYQIQFDPRIGTEARTPAYRAFPTLAVSDGLLQSVVEAYTPSAQAGIGHWSLGALRQMAEATSEGDPSLVLLTVTSLSAQDAAAIANAWADALVKRGDEIYGQSAGDVAFFETQVEQAKTALDQAEAALVEFQARNQDSIVSAQLDSLRQAQADYLADQRAVSSIVQDIQGLRAQLADQPAGQSVSLADNLTALLLQIKAFNAQASTPIQLQVDNTVVVSNRSQAEQVTFLEDLATTLQTKSGEIDARLAELEPQILSLQQTIQEISVENDQLTRTRDLARETYMTLARKLDEARIEAQENNGMLEVGSYAAVPVEPVGPRRLISTAVAGMLGLMVGAVGVLTVEFWRQGKTPVQMS